MHHTDFNHHHQMKGSRDPSRSPPPSPNPSWPILLWLTIIVAFVFLAVMAGPTTTKLDQQRYCRMVALHQHDPATGWPDFHHSFAQECNLDGSVKENQP